MSEQTVSRADAKVIAETAVDLADKAVNWKARALAAEEALSKFAGEIYAKPATECAPVAVDEDGWAEWVHPVPGFLLQCCDCGLVHEMQVRIAKDNGDGAALNEGERRNGRVIVFRMCRPPTATTPARNTSQIGEG